MGEEEANKNWGRLKIPKLEIIFNTSADKLQFKILLEKNRTKQYNGMVEKLKM